MCCIYYSGNMSCIQGVTYCIILIWYNNHTCQVPGSYEGISKLFNTLYEFKITLQCHYREYKCCSWSYWYIFKIDYSGVQTPLLLLCQSCLLDWKVDSYYIRQGILRQAWARLGSALVMLKLVPFVDYLVVKFQSDLK